MNIKGNDTVPGDGGPAADVRGDVVSRRHKAGRKAKAESRGEELRTRLLAWQKTPDATRPSLRSLAKELNTSHTLLQHYLQPLGPWHPELEQWRTNMAARGIKVTPAMEKRFLAYQVKFEARLAARQARGAAKLAAWHAAHPGFAKKVRAWIDSIENRWSNLPG
jgi:hypothetical protein